MQPSEQALDCPAPPGNRQECLPLLGSVPSPEYRLEEMEHMPYRPVLSTGQAGIPYLGCRYLAREDLRGRFSRFGYGRFGSLDSELSE